MVGGYRQVRFPVAIEIRRGAATVSARHGNPQPVGELAFTFVERHGSRVYPPRDDVVQPVFAQVAQSYAGRPANLHLIGDRRLELAVSFAERDDPEGIDQLRNAVSVHVADSEPALEKTPLPLFKYTKA